MKPYRFLSILALSTVSAVLVPASQFSAHADGTPVLAYNSFGTGFSYSNLRWVVSGSASQYGYQGHAESFVSGVSGYLSQIRLATIVEGGTPDSNFFIAQDNGSGLPGSILESYSDVLDSNNGLLTLNSVTDPLLQAGQKYWLCDEPNSSGTLTGWYENNQGLTGNDAFETTGSGGSWTWFNLGSSGSTDSVFSISVVPVPEPATVGLLILGAGLLAGQCRRRICKA